MEYGITGEWKRNANNICDARLNIPAFVIVIMFIRLGAIVEMGDEDVAICK